MATNQAVLNYGVIYNYALSIGTAQTAGAWTYSPLAVGIENEQEVANEVVQTYQFLSGKGVANHFVTGAAPQINVQVRRVYGDTAQDYIFETAKPLFGAGRESSMKIVKTDSNGTVVSTETCPITITDIIEINGASTDVSQGSFSLRYNGSLPVAGA